MGMTIRALVAITALAFAGEAAAAQWKQVAKGAPGELWVDVASVKRNNGEVAFEYRLDMWVSGSLIRSSTWRSSSVSAPCISRSICLPSSPER